MSATFLAEAEKLRIAAALIAECNLDLVERAARDASIAADLEGVSYLRSNQLLEVARAARPVHDLMHRYFKENHGSADEATDD